MTPGVRTMVPPSGVRSPGQQGHQGRLADAVAPDETNPLTLLHMQVGGIEKRLAAQIERDAL